MCVSLFFGSRRGARGKVVKKISGLGPFTHFNFVFLFDFVFVFFGGREGGPEARLSRKTSGLGPFTHCLIFFVFVCQATLHTE